MPSITLSSRLDIYVTILVTILAKASSIHVKSPINIQCTKSESHPTKVSCTDRSPCVRDLSNLLRFRGGGDRGGDYGSGGDGSGAPDYDYNHGDRDHATARNESQDRYDNDYYGNRYQNQNDDYRREEYNDDYKMDKKPLWKSTKSSSSTSFIPGVIRNGNKKIGFALLGSGAVFTILGVTLFFNKTLMRLGNLLFIAGIPITIGPGRTSGYFFQPKKARATGSLAVGIFLVMIGWPIFGIMLEIFGIMNLFGNMFPLLKMFLKQVPVVGGIFNDKSKTKENRKPQRRNYDDDRNYYSGHDDERHDGDQCEEENGYERRYNY